MTRLSDPVATVHELCVDDGDLATRYLAAVAPDPADQADEPREPHEADDDGQSWDAFLAGHGPYWDGTEHNWAAFRAWFLHEAGDNALTGPATAFIAHAEQNDKRATFLEYGITLPEVAPEVPGAEVRPVSGMGDDPAAAFAAVVAEVGLPALETVLAVALGHVLRDNVPAYTTS